MSDSLPPRDPIATRIRNTAANNKLSVFELAARPDKVLLREPNFGRKCLHMLRANYPNVDIQQERPPLASFSDAELLLELLRRIGCRLTDESI